MGTSPRLRADVFPANLVVAPSASPNGAASTFAASLPEDHRKVEKCRVVVTLEQVLVFADSSSGPQLIFSDNIVDYTPPNPRAAKLRNLYNPREALITTESGKTLAFHRASGCGCGSRLKSFRPFGEGTTYAVSSTQDVA